MEIAWTSAGLSSDSAAIGAKRALSAYRTCPVGDRYSMWAGLKWKTRARSLVFSTSLPPALCAAAERALQLCEQEESLREILQFLTQIPRPTGALAPVFDGIDLYTRRGDFATDKNGYLVNGKFSESA